jgi:hypothetical protein
MISTGTLGEKKANVKLHFVSRHFHRTSPATQRQKGYSEKRVAYTHAASPRSIPACPSSRIARRALDLDPGNFGNPWHRFTPESPVSPCVFSSKTHRCWMVSSASMRVPV